MKRYYTSLFLFLFLMTAGAQETKQLSGKIFDETTGQPIENVNVELYFGSYGFLRDYSDKNGKYEFQVPERLLEEHPNLLLSFLAPGYENHTQKVAPDLKTVFVVPLKKKKRKGFYVKVIDQQKGQSIEGAKVYIDSAYSVKTNQVVAFVEVPPGTRAGDKLMVFVSKVGMYKSEAFQVVYRKNMDIQKVELEPDELTLTELIDIFKSDFDYYKGYYQNQRKRLHLEENLIEMHDLILGTDPITEDEKHLKEVFCYVFCPFIEFLIKFHIESNDLLLKHEKKVLEFEKAYQDFQIDPPALDQFLEELIHVISLGKEVVYIKINLLPMYDLREKLIKDLQALKTLEEYLAWLIDDSKENITQEELELMKDTYLEISKTTKDLFNRLQYSMEFETKN